MQKLDSCRQLLLALYVYAATQKKCGARVSAILDSFKDTPAPEGYEPFAGESPSVPPIGGDF